MKEVISETNRHRRKIFHTMNGKTIQLYNTDCLKGMDLFPDNYFDVIITSPPYNIGTSYSLYDDRIPREKYLEWIKNVALKIKQKMKTKGSFFLNIGSSPTKPWNPFEIALSLRPHFYLQNDLTWVKSIYIENESYGNKINLNVGHYKPIQGLRFLNNTHEYLFHFTKDGNVQLDRLSIGVPHKDKGNINRWKSATTNNGIRCRGNTWYFPYKTISSRNKDRPHPATFPLELAETCIKLHGISDDNKEWTVLDPFMGIGSTSLACYKLNVNCIGFEIDKQYYETNIYFLENEIAKKPLSFWNN